MSRKKRITKKVLFVKTIEILQPLLNLSDWKIRIRFSSRMRGTADCDASPEYKEALIRLNMKELKFLQYQEIVAMAIHEMMHCIVWPLTEWTEALCKRDEHKLNATLKLEETLVTNLEKILMNTVTDYLQQELADQGYSNVDMVFQELHVDHEH
jgi:hypothetical protein